MIVALDDHGQGQCRRPGPQHLAAGRFAHDRRDGGHPRRQALRTPAARRRADAAGQALARRARAVLLEMREVDREIADLKSGKGGTVFLGSVTAPAIELAVPAIQRIREQLSAHRDQHPGRHQHRAGARAARVAPRFHHRPHSRRPQSAAVREQGDRHREGLPDRAARPSADRARGGAARPPGRP